MKIFLRIALYLFVTILFVQCKDNSNADAATESHEEGHEHEEESTVSFTAEQAKTIGIETGALEYKQIASSLKANGFLKVPNQNKATIQSMYSGVVQAILIEPGHAVKKGQVIAKVANPEFIQVQNEYLNTLSQVQKAVQEYDRQKMLFEGNAGALKNLQAAEATLQTLRNQESMYAKQIRLMGVNPATVSNGNLVSELAIRSPISGVVSEIGVEMGSFVNTSTMVASIIDNSKLHVDLFIYEQDLPRLQKNQTIHFTLTNNPGKEYDAQIFSLGNTFEDDSKAVSVHAEVLGNKEGLIDGMSVTAIISLGAANVKAVPNEAIVSDQGKDYIFMVVNHQEEEPHSHGDEDHSHADDGNMTFKKVLIAKGATDIGYTEIEVLHDMPADTRVVTKGAFFVLAKMNDSGGHSHAH